MTPEYDGYVQQGKSSFPRLRPVNFWARHIACILGLISLFYFNTQTLFALTQINAEDLNTTIRLMSNFCYGLIASYFVVHYTISMLARAIDAGAKMIFIMIGLTASFVGFAVFYPLVTAERISQIPLAYYAFLVPLLLMYILMVLPSDALRRGTNSPELKTPDA